MCEGNAELQLFVQHSLACRPDLLICCSTPALEQCPGWAGISAGPSPEAVQSHQLLGPYAGVSNTATGFPAFKLGGGIKVASVTFAVAPTLPWDEKQRINKNKFKHSC